MGHFEPQVLLIKVQEHAIGHADYTLHEEGTCPKEPQPCPYTESSRPYSRRNIRGSGHTGDGVCLGTD
jgi:hypothetical protein